MKPKRWHWIHSRLKSIPYALDGLQDMLKTQHNAWIHLLFTVFALWLAAWLGFDRLRFTMIVVAIVLVWMAEAFNTVFEILLDILSPDDSPKIKRAKDVAAAGVLITAAGALMIGLALFGPPLYQKILEALPKLSL